MVGFLFAFDVVLSLWGFDPWSSFLFPPQCISLQIHICLGQVRWFVSMSANIWLLKWSVLPFKVSLADVMHKKRSFRVCSRVTYPRRWTISHLHWVVHA